MSGKLFSKSLHSIQTRGMTFTEDVTGPNMMRFPRRPCFLLVFEQSSKSSLATLSLTSETYDVSFPPLGDPDSSTLAQYSASSFTSPMSWFIFKFVLLQCRSPTIQGVIGHISLSCFSALQRRMDALDVDSCGLCDSYTSLLGSGIR